MFFYNAGIGVRLGLAVLLSLLVFRLAYWLC